MLVLVLVLVPDLRIRTGLGLELGLELRLDSSRNATSTICGGFTGTISTATGFSGTTTAAGSTRSQLHAHNPIAAACTTTLVRSTRQARMESL